jgi:glycosyltransferase involved in cell wall biosynthesis
MKILCVIDNLGSGGAQRQLVNLACGLKKHGHHIEFFVYYPDNFLKPILDKEGIPIHLCFKKHRFSIGPITKLRKIISNLSFDAIIAFLETPCVYAEIASVGLKKLKVVASERNVICEENKDISKWFKVQLHRLADIVTCNSFTQAKFLIESFPWIKQRLKVITNGVDLRNLQKSVRNQCAS